MNEDSIPINLINLKNNLDNDLIVFVLIWLLPSPEQGKKFKLIKINQG